MKNVFAVLLLLVVTSTFAQKSIKLKVVYEPNHQYNIATRNLTNMLM